MSVQTITAWNKEKTPEFSPQNPGEIPEIPEIPENSENSPIFLTPPGYLACIFLV